MIKPVSVKIVDDYKLFVQFSDGIEGDINLVHLKNDPNYAFMSDKNEFGKVFIDKHTFNLSWTSGATLCKNAIYKQLELKALMKRLKIDLEKI